jgi:hypothetical protein
VASEALAPVAVLNANLDRPVVVQKGGKLVQQLLGVRLRAIR